MLGSMLLPTQELPVYTIWRRNNKIGKV